ncbi:MAG: preprotein translocase subunit YajC [Acutalibacteraceae bacterium]
MGNLFGNSQTGQVASSLLVYAVLIIGLYLVVFRPNQKRKKQEEEMRKALAIGDEITTIGGIVGRVVSLREDSDSLVIETASEKIRIKKWAIASRNTNQENNK